MKRYKQAISILIALVLVLSTAVPAFGLTNAQLYKEHQVEMDQVFNLRDLGGYKTKDGKKQIRKGLLFRSGELSYATAADIRKLRKELKIKQIFDYRCEVDRKYCPDRKIRGAKNTLLPLRSSTPAKAQKAKRRYKYFKALIRDASSEEFHGEFAAWQHKAIREYTTKLFLQEKVTKQYKKYFKALLKNKKRKPVLFHCIAGKDRTGVCAVLTLLALGVDEKTAIRDYELSNTGFRLNHSADYGGMKKAVRTSDLKYALKQVKKKYGSYNKYFRKVYGLTQSDLKKLRKIYLRPVPKAAKSS